MTPITDALGNIIGYEDDAAPTPVASTISPLDTVKDQLKKIAAHSHPMLAPLYLRDMSRIGTNMLSPFVGAGAGALGNIQARGAEQLHRAVGDEASAIEAANRVVRPDAPEQAARFQADLQTPLMQQTQESLGKTFDALHLPAGGPGSGMPGSMPISPRPLITPHDVRVLGAEATRVGRQVRDIPTDFQNAQSGVTRLDTVTNQPTMGAKLQGLAEDVGRIAEQRKAQGLSILPGVPEAFTPETSMYAMRPAKTQMTTPVVPATAQGYSPAHNYTNEIIEDVIGNSHTLTPPQVMHEINTRHLNEANSEPHLRLEFKQELRDFTHKQIEAMFPDAPTFKDAKSAYETMFSDLEARATNGMKLYDMFLETPEGQRLKGALDLPTTGEVEAQHGAAANWLRGQLSNYIRRSVGAEGEPLASRAAEGLTIMSPKDIMEDAAALIDNTDLRARRREAGMPEETPLETAEQAKFQELQAANQALRTAEGERTRLGEVARSQGLLDPADLPEYAATTNPVQKLARQRDKLQEEFNNLQLGIAYEKLSDSGIKVQTAAQLKADLPYAAQQFFPSLAKTPDTEKVYTPRPTALNALGFSKIAKDFYEDVMSRKIPLNKVDKTSVDAYVRKAAETRAVKEKAEKAEIAAYVAKAQTNMLKTLEAMVPNSKVFGNVGALEITNALPLEEIVRLVSDDTAVLDHCIAEGCSAAEGTRNPWAPAHAKRRYEPIYDPATGRLNPKATRDSTSYARAAVNGDQLISMRNMETGLPVATFQFHLESSPTGQPQYTIGFASGFKNGAVKPEYVDDIKAYLNSRAGDIKNPGSDLRDNLGLYDTKSSSGMNQVRQDAHTGMLAAELSSIDFSGLPRFVTTKDFKDYIANGAPAASSSVALQNANVERLATIKTTLMDNAESVVGDAVRNSSLQDTDELERRLGGVFTVVNRDYFPTFTDDPLPTLNRIIDFIGNEMDRRVNNASDLSQEMVTALGEYAAELEYARDDLERGPPPEVQRANLPAAVQQNIDRRNQHITDAYETALTPNTNMHAVDEALSEFADTLSTMATNMFGNGYNASEIAENLAARVHAEHMSLVAPDRIVLRGLTPTEADIIRSRLNTAYGNLSTIREMGVPAPEQPVQLETFTPQEPLSMAHELLEQERVDGGQVHIASVEDSIHALRAGMFDDPRIRAFTPDVGTAFANSVANALETLLQQEQAAQPTPTSLNLAYNTAEHYINTNLIPGPLQGQSFADLDQNMRNAIMDMHEREIVNALPEGVSANDILFVIRRLRENNPIPYAAPAPTQPDNVFGIQGQALRITNRDRELYTMLSDVIDNAIEEGAPLPDPTDGEAYAQLILDDEIGGEFTELTDAERRRLASIVRRYGVGATLTPTSANAQPVQPVRPAPATAPFDILPASVIAESDTGLTRSMSREDRLIVHDTFDQIAHAYNTEELRNIIALVRTHAMQVWEDFSPEQREWLARNLETYLNDNTPPDTPPPEGYKKGGQVRTYQVGGAVNENIDEYGEENNAPLDDYERMKLERWMSKRPEFHVPSKEFNDDNPDAERDDDIHVPKASTFDGKLQTPWDDDEWVMRNYIRKHHMEMFANGGIVHETPSLAQMRAALMMRS